MKKNRTFVKNKPRGYIYGAKWGSIACIARIVMVTVGVAPHNWWCSKLVGTERQAIQVQLEGKTVYIDNENNWALTVMLRGAAPLPRFRFVPAFAVTDDPNSEVFYKTKVD